MSIKYTSNNLQDTRKIAREVLHELDSNNGAKVICLSGDLGAGKTAFAKEMAMELGVKEVVTSPTFVIQKTYPLKPLRGHRVGKPKNLEFDQLIHIDAYRLENGKELASLGFNELLEDSGNLILIEWSENVQDILPSGAMKIEFEIMDNDERRIIVDS